MKNLVASAAYGTSVKAGARGTVPVIRVSNITRQGDLSLTKTAAVDLPPAELERYAVAEGDVLLCRSSAHESVVKAAIVREETTAVYAANVIRLRPENAKDAEYIAAFLTSAHAKLAVSEMATMNPANLLAMLMPLPSATVRATFAERIREIRLARTTQILQLARLNELHASLQHRGFSGRL
jgi:type I restriction enzyme S subunit